MKCDKCGKTIYKGEKFFPFIEENLSGVFGMWTWHACCSKECKMALVQEIEKKEKEAQLKGLN